MIVEIIPEVVCQGERGFGFSSSIIFGITIARTITGPSIPGLIAGITLILVWERASATLLASHLYGRDGAPLPPFNGSISVPYPALSIRTEPA